SSHSHTATPMNDYCMRPAAAWLKCLNPSRFNRAARFSILSTLSRLGLDPLLSGLSENWWISPRHPKRTRFLMPFCWQHVLYAAVFSGQSSTFRVVKERTGLRSFDIDDLGYAAFRMAAIRGNLVVLKLLLLESMLPS